MTETTIYRWLREGLLPGEQTKRHAPWRIRLTAEIRARFVPDVPDDYLPLEHAAKQLGGARQTVLHKVQRGELEAVQVTKGRRKGYEFGCCGPELDCLINDDPRRQCDQGPGGPSRTTFSLACRKSSCPRCSTTGFLTEALEGEVELLKRLARREAGRLDPALAAVGLTGGDLGGEHHLREALVAPLLLAGALGELGQRPGCGRRLQGAEEVRELRRLAHAGISAS